MTEAFFNGYLECALWLAHDENGEPANYDASDIAPESLAQMRADCAGFYASNSDAWQSAGMSDDYAGHDFWLTRNRHGAGFWDRGLGDVGDSLTDASHAYGECDLYVGDDGKVYV